MARREHSRDELAGKLAGYGDPGEIAPLLDALQQEGLLSDARYAEALRQARAGRHGSVRLREDLRRKGVSAELIESECREARAADLEAARQVWCRRFAALPADPREKARQFRYLLGRGFPSEVVAQVLGGRDDDS